MDCETCGCYRPSWEIAPIPDQTGRLVMACASCRQLVTGRWDPSPIVLDPVIVAGHVVPPAVPLPVT